MPSVTVDRDALIALLDYAQPDEETDFANLEDGNSAEGHTDYVRFAIRVLRESSLGGPVPLPVALVGTGPSFADYDFDVTVVVEGGGYYKGRLVNRDNGLVTISPDDERWADINPDKIVSITHDGEFALHARLPG